MFSKLFGRAGEGVQGSASTTSDTTVVQLSTAKLDVPSRRDKGWHIVLTSTQEVIAQIKEINPDLLEKYGEYLNTLKEIIAYRKAMDDKETSDGKQLLHDLFNILSMMLNKAPRHVGIRLVRARLLANEGREYDIVKCLSPLMASPLSDPEDEAEKLALLKIAQPTGTQAEVAAEEEQKTVQEEEWQVVNRHKRKEETNKKPKARFGADRQGFYAKPGSAGKVSNPAAHKQADRSIFQPK